MPRKRIFHKHTKRAINIRKALQRKKLQQHLCEDNAAIDPIPVVLLQCSAPSSDGSDVEGESNVKADDEDQPVLATPAPNHAVSVVPVPVIDEGMTSSDAATDPENDEDIDFAPLIVERVPYDDEEINLPGRRVVDINHIFKQFQIISMHPLKCTMGKYKLKKEYLSGLLSKWTFYCDNCEKEFIVTSAPLSQLLTASKFGVVVKRLPHTPCHNLVKSMLYPRSLNTEAVTFGRDNESRVVEMYEEQTSKIVEPCGLFVDVENVFLGASPDGLVDEDRLIEIKCLHSVSGLTLKEELTQKKKKNICLEFNSKGSIQLKRQHNYFYQVQGQLNICKRRWCDFVVYTKKGEIFVETIERDERLWETVMLPKLVLFYKTCILPELADSRIVRGLKVRDPPHILDAIEKRKLKDGSKK